MYTLGLIASYCVLYLFIFSAIPFLLYRRTATFTSQTLTSFAAIIGFCVALPLISGFLSDMSSGNRIVHTFFSGFIAVFVSFFAIKDTAVRISRLQFFVLGILVATLFFAAMHKISEDALQSTLGVVFVESTENTWLHLMINTMGAIVSALGLLFFLPRSNQNR